jgi:hypothetical protein
MRQPETRGRSFSDGYYFAAGVFVALVNAGPWYDALGYALLGWASVYVTGRAFAWYARKHQSRAHRSH